LQAPHNPEIAHYEITHHQGFAMFKHLPKFIFFTGKGGVGKTSLACASALKFADDGQRVLLVSTDPASNVGQVFSTEIGNRITAIESVPGLDAIEIDPEQAAEQYRQRILSPVRDQLPAEALARMTEQLSGACTTEIAAFDEFTELLTDEQLVAHYDRVIFDTAPTGHTIRLLQLPGAWSGFLEQGQGDASCLGPLAGLEKQRDRYARAVERLGDADTTRMILVARPRNSALTEVARTARELAAIGITNLHLAINGLMPDDDADDPLARALIERDRQALAAMDSALKDLPVDRFPLRAENLVGFDALRRLAAGAGIAADSTLVPFDPGAELPGLGDLIDQLEQPGKGLIMFMGKGGVGKTTMAAATAVKLARRGHEVLLSTTDPAAHLTGTVAGELAGLSVSRIDPVAATARYREHVMETRGKGLDDAGRAMLEEDLRSPCTEEIAVFQAFSRVIREAGHKFVVLDTAPTGHTLLLLDATGSYHRDILRHSDANSRTRFITPMMRLQDTEQTRVILVTLAETTPVLEAAGLQEDLRRAGIHPWAWIVNSSLAAASSKHPLLSRRAQAELSEIERVRTQYAERIAVVPMQAVEPVGIAALSALGRSPSAQTDSAAVRRQQHHAAV